MINVACMGRESGWNCGKEKGVCESGRFCGRGVRSNRAETDVAGSR